MKNVIVIFLLFISVQIQSQQVEFEKVLGKENVKTLNYLIKDFEENILDKLYPNQNIQDKYKNFIVDYSKKKIDVNSENFKRNKKKFDESKLKYFIYCEKDSIYFGKSIYNPKDIRKKIICKYKCFDTDKTFKNWYQETTYSEDEKRLKRDISLFEKRREFNTRGFFLKALKKVPNKSDFLKLYLEEIELTGEAMSYSRMPYILLKNKVNLNDYFVKRLILIEFMYHFK